MNKLLLLLLFFTFHLHVFGQKNYTVKLAQNASQVYGKYYHKPKFNGDLITYIHKNTHYPDMAREGEIQGTEVIRFIIDEKGSIQQPSIIRSIGGGCDEEVLRTVKFMPKWTPATYKGRPVSVVYILPIKFGLE